jgi:hypothetical protein
MGEARRARSVGTKLTEEEYAKLEVWSRSGERRLGNACECGIWGM